MHAFEKYGDVEIGAFWYSERSTSTFSSLWMPPQPNNYNGTHLVVIARDTATGSLYPYVVDSTNIPKTREGIVNAILDHNDVDEKVRYALHGFVEFTKNKTKGDANE